MNDLSNEKTMTVKEISEILGLSERTIQIKAKELFPDIIRERETTYFNQHQVTLIKNSCEKKFAVETQEDRNNIVMKAIQILIEDKQKLEEENNKLKNQNELVQKRVNLLIHNSKTYTSTEIAKELNLRSALELNKILSEKGVQFKVNKTWVLHAKYSDCDYELIKSEELDNGRVVYNRHWTGKGRDFIVNLLRGEL